MGIRAFALGVVACVLSVGLALPVPVHAQKAHFGQDGPAVLPDRKVSAGGGAVHDVPFEQNLAITGATAHAIQYVAVGGDDSNDGLSWGTAKRTLQDAADALRAGGTVSIGAGDYTLPTTGVAITLPIFIQCARGGNTTLRYTGTGSAITFAYGGGLNGAGMAGCRMIGPGSTTSAIAIQLASGKQGVQATTIENVSIGLHNTPSQGFGVGVSMNPDIGGSNLDQRLVNCTITANGIGVEVWATEQFMIFGGSISGNTVGLKTHHYASDVSVYGTSFDTNSQYGIDAENEGVINLHGAHFEDNFTGYTAFIYQSGKFRNSVNMLGGLLLEDQASGIQTDFVKVDCQYCSFNAYGAHLWSRGRTVKQAVEFSAVGASGNLQFYNIGPGSFTNEYVVTSGRPTYSHIVDIPINASGSKNEVTMEQTNIYLPSGEFFTQGAFGLGSPSSSIKISRVTSPPTGSCTTGDIRINTSGRAGTTLYVCEAGSWAGK